MTRLLLACLALALALPQAVRPEDVPDRYRLWGPLDPLAAPTFATRIKLVRAGRLPAYCRAALGASRSVAPPVPDHVHSPDCHIRTAVRPSRLGRAELRPERMRCEIALRLAMWERHALQPAARAILGTEVAEIEHLGAYSCRQMRTSRGLSARWSEHARANAFDISGFRLADGRRLTLTRDWAGQGADARFLRAARDGLCRYFRTVLSPDYNALHADHFHVDQGLFLTCR